MAKILVVDDERFTRKVLQAQLEALDYEVHGASDFDSAMRMLTEKEPQLVLCDIRMPGRDGIALLAQMRQITEGTHVEILAASIKTPDEAIEALRAGAHHLTLPLDVIRAMGEHDLSRQTIDEFAAAIVRLIEDRTLAKRLGRAGRSTVIDEFSWEAIARRHLALFDEHLDR